ncbi:MAG TPA: tetratricopeptide repeat protein [Candidatus Kapabacteria bacterium]|nr:tetratricopeptide repeat protein [Candidatus Kapabacteria bacterium]
MSFPANTSTIVLLLGASICFAGNVSKSELPVQPNHDTVSTKPSEEYVQLVPEEVVTNQITKLERSTKLARYQIALESARGLRKAKELRRAESTLVQLLESPAAEEIKRPALLELGLVMQEQKEYPKAQQLYSEYVRRYEHDASVPDVLLRQAYLYREMGLSVLAQSKFYAVISTGLNLKLDQTDYYRRLVLRAQAEIAETHFLQGQYEDAADYLNRLLKLENVDLERASVLHKLAQCYSKMNRYDECLATATLFLEKFPNHIDAPETRFLRVDALKKLGRNKESIVELEILLKTQLADATSDPQQWLYWQQRAGNTIANEFYKDGDLLSALQIYHTLAEINSSPEWQLPAWYQIGLAYENLKHTQKAAEMYGKIIERQKELKTANPNVSAVIEMAAWRKQSLDWEAAAKHATRLISDLQSASAPTDNASN